MREQLWKLVEQHADSGAQQIDLAEKSAALATSRLRDFLAARGLINDAEEPQDAAIRLLQAQQPRTWSDALKNSGALECERSLWDDS